MIHLDTFGISFIAKDLDLRESFIRFLNMNNECLLLNTFQLMELIKTNSKEFNDQIISLIKSISNKRFLTIAIPEVIYQEIASIYYNDRILTPSEFVQEYTTDIPQNISIEELLQGAEKTWIEMKENQQSWVGGALFGKFMASQQKYPKSGKLKVKDFLTRLSPFVSCSPFDRVEAVAAFDKHAPAPNDMIAFSQYMHIVNRVDRSRGQDLVQWIQESIKRFHFPEVVYDWKSKKFIEQDFFLRIATHALKKMPDVRHTPELFYKKINIMDLKSFPGFFMMQKVTEYLKRRPQEQKPSDYFDLFFISLLPYVSVFLCDSEIYSAINQVLKCQHLKVSFNHCNWQEFINKINRNNI